MNGKRQTIWLVSMLSLMVVLSAYYLFTEDSGTSTQPIANNSQVGEMVTDPLQNTASEAQTGEETVVTEVVSEGETVTDDEIVIDVDEENGVSSPDQVQKTEEQEESAGAPSQTDQAQNTEENAEENAGEDASATTKSDDEILKEVSSQVSAMAQLDNYLLERSENNVKQESELYAKINDMNTTPEASAEAHEQLKTLEEKEAIITGIEENLQQKYANAVVKQEEDKYKVLVISDKLEVKDAVSIVNMVIKELNVGQDKVSVQYVAP